MKDTQITPGQIRQLIEIDDTRRKKSLPGIRRELQEFIKYCTEGGTNAGVAAAIEPISSAPYSYRISVDRSLTVPQMIEAAGYSDDEEYASEITEERFPIDRSGKLKYEKELFLVSPSSPNITIARFLAELKLGGWEVEQVPELLALGIRSPDLPPDLSEMLQFIVAFGSTCPGEENQLLSPMLWVNDGAWHTDIKKYARTNKCLICLLALVSRKQT